MLESVVGDEGTARRGDDPGLPGGRQDRHRAGARRRSAAATRGYTASFIGFAPADDPQFVVAVILQKPSSGHYGGVVAAPVFQQVMTYALAARGVPPTGTRPPQGARSGTADAVAAATGSLTDRADPAVPRTARRVPHRLGGARGRSRGPPVAARRAADVQVTGGDLDSRAVRPGDLYAALPGARTHGAGSPRRPPTPAPSPCSPTRRAPARGRRPGCRCSSSPTRAPCSAPSPPGSTATRRTRLRMFGVTGTNGKTTTAYLVEARCAARGRATGLIGTVETRVGDERAAQRPRPRPEAPDLHALLALMVERGRRRRASMEVSSHALALGRVDGVGLRRRRVHQPLPGPPRLPRRHGGLLRGQGRAVHARARRAAASSASTTRGAAGWPAAAEAGVPVTTRRPRSAAPTPRTGGSTDRRRRRRGGTAFTLHGPDGARGRGPRARCPATSTSPTPPLGRSLLLVAAGVARGRRRPLARRRRPGAGPDGARSAAPGAGGAARRRRLRAHPRRGRPPPLRGAARRRRRAGWSSCSAPAATGTAASGR